PGGETEIVLGRAETSRRLAVGTRWLRTCTTAGRMKRCRERARRLGEKRRGGGKRERPAHSAVGTLPGAKGAGNRNPKKRRGGVSCGEVHSQARELVEQGYERKLVATVLA